MFFASALSQRRVPICVFTRGAQPRALGGALNMRDDTSDLSAWSKAVRESSLKRLRLVPPGSENWRPVPGSMSFGDLAQHIVDADLWLFRKLELRTLQPMHGHAATVHISARQDYLDILSRLDQTGKQRSELIQQLSPPQLSELITDQRFGGEVSVWWVIVRGNLDHETHHRGQIAVYLRIAGIIAS
jgi:uncharacterized damage-inducible protein DinB